MPRLPNPGSDADNWGALLNEFLQVSHNENGTLRNSYSIFNVRDFGAKGDGQADDHTAIQAALKSAAKIGGTVYLPAGVYKTSEIILPLGHVNLIGEGIGITFLLPAAANQRLLRAPTTAEEPIYIYEMNHIGGFTIQAHPGGSTGEAILMDRFRTNTLHDIEFQDNGAGYFTYGILLTSVNLCYGNVIRHVVVQAQQHESGLSTVISLQNVNPADIPLPATPNLPLWVYNPNANMIENIWILENGGISTIIDARRSAQTTIRGGLMEGNAGAIGIIPGTANPIEGIWFERLGQAILPQLGDGNGSSNAVRLLNNYFSGGIQTLTIPGGLQDWEIRGNVPDVYPQLIDHGSNNLVNYGAKFSGDPVTINSLAIGSGTPITKVISVIVPLDFGSTSAQANSDLTISMNGAALGDVVALGTPNTSVLPNSAFSTWVSDANIITVRFNNYSSQTLSPPSGSFRVAIIKF